MSLGDDIDLICRQYRSDISIIKQFVMTTYASLSDLRSIVEHNKASMSKEDAKALRAVANALKDVVGQKNKEVKISTTTSVADLVIKIAQSIKSRDFLAEMSLSYLIAHQEAFIKDLLVKIFKSRSNLLRSSRSMTFEEILKFGSAGALRQHMAERETESIGYGSIDDLSNYLIKKFNIDPTKESFWVRLREASYRRNLIIHNRSFVNETYRRKVKSEAPLKSRLSTDGTYVSEAADAVSAFVDYIQQNMSRKLRLSRRRGRGHC